MDENLIEFSYRKPKRTIIKLSDRIDKLRLSADCIRTLQIFGFVTVGQLYRCQAHKLSEYLTDIQIKEVSNCLKNVLKQIRYFQSGGNKHGSCSTS